MIPLPVFVASLLAALLVGVALGGALVWHREQLWRLQLGDLEARSRTYRSRPRWRSRRRALHLARSRDDQRLLGWTRATHGSLGTLVPGSLVPPDRQVVPQQPAPRRPRWPGAGAAS